MSRPHIGPARDSVVADPNTATIHSRQEADSCTPVCRTHSIAGRLARGLLKRKASLRPIRAKSSGHEAGLTRSPRKTLLALDEPGLRRPAGSEKGAKP